MNKETQMIHDTNFDTHQVGGNHYSTKISPIEYILANNLDFCEGNVVKYISRYENKNGAEDLLKVVTYTQFLLKKKYNINSTFDAGEGKIYITNDDTLHIY